MLNASMPKCLTSERSIVRYFGARYDLWIFLTRSQLTRRYSAIERIVLKWSGSSMIWAKDRVWRVFPSAKGRLGHHKWLYSWHWIRCIITLRSSYILSMGGIRKHLHFCPLRIISLWLHFGQGINRSLISTRKMRAFPRNSVRWYVTPLIPMEW